MGMRWGLGMRKKTVDSGDSPSTTKAEGKENWLNNEKQAETRRDVERGKAAEETGPQEEGDRLC